MRYVEALAMVPRKIPKGLASSFGERQTKIVSDLCAKDEESKEVAGRVVRRGIISAAGL